MTHAPIYRGISLLQYLRGNGFNRFDVSRAKRVSYIRIQYNIGRYTIIIIPDIRYNYIIIY